MLARDEDILKAAEDWRRAGRGVALATVVETWGSAPRPVGSNLVIDTDGNFLGSVSGGCVEGAVVTEALDVIELRAAEDAGIRCRRRDRLEGRPLLRRYHPGVCREGGVDYFVIPGRRTCGEPGIQTALPSAPLDSGFARRRAPRNDGKARRASPSPASGRGGAARCAPWNDLASRVCVFDPEDI